MPLSPHLRAALWITSGAALFVLLLVARLLRTMMQDPNFGRGDNPFELLSLVACVLGPLLALVTAMGLAFRLTWSRKLGRIAAGVLVFAALAILVSAIIAGAAESRQTAELIWAQSLTGIASIAGAFGIYQLLRRVPTA